MSKPQRKVFLIISLIILLSEAFFVCINYYSDKHTLQTALSKEGQQTQKTFQVALATTLDSMSHLATFVANTTNVQGLMSEAERAASGTKRHSDISSAEIRQELYEVLSPGWQKMTNEYQVRQLHFHLGPGSTSFLRVHKPEKFGDNMDDLRHLVVDVNRDGQPRQGFELGRIYAGLRGVAPIFSFADPEKQVGALEVGTSFRTLIDSLSTSIGSNVAVLLRDERVDESVWKLPENVMRSICNCFVEATSSNELEEVITVLENDPKIRPVSEGRTRLLETKSGPVTVTEFALWDYVGTRDQHELPVGRVVIWRSAEQVVQGLHRDTWANIIYAAVVFLLIELALYFGMRLALGRLEATVASRTRDIVLLNSKLKEMANRDVLTGVYSRRYLMERVQQELSRVARDRHSAVLLMLDLDHFKQVNDTWGHQAGDTVLSELGRIMLDGSRIYDVVGRYGGEEFAILIPDAGEETGYQIAEKLRRRVEVEIEIPGNSGVAVTISVGVAAYRDGYSKDDWFAAADAALYEAKREGRNRVVISA